MKFLSIEERKYHHDDILVSTDWLESNLNDPSLEILDLETLVILGKNNIKTKDDLADLSSDELLEIVGDKIQGLEEANKIIMKAREDWFNDIS